MSFLPTLGKVLGGLQNTQDLTNYLKNILDSKIYPFWCKESASAFQTWSANIVQEQDSLCGSYVAELLAVYVKLINASQVLSVMPIYFQLNNLIDLTYRINIIDPLWESIYKLHMSLQNANPVCFHSYFFILVKTLMNSISDSTVQFGLRQARLKALNSMLKSTPDELRSTLKVTDVHIIKELVSSLKEAGDYDLQANLIEAVFYLTSHSERESGVNSWFPNLDDQIKQLFININKHFPDCRKFLNAYNNQLELEKKVFTYPCTAKLGNYYLKKPKIPTYENLWVDFNIRSATVSLPFDQSESNKPELDKFIINEHMISLAKLIIKKYGHSLVLNFNEDQMEYFCSTFSQTSKALLSRDLRIEFSTSTEELEELCLIVFKDKLQIQNLTEESVPVIKENVPVYFATDKVPVIEKNVPVSLNTEKFSDFYTEENSKHKAALSQNNRMLMASLQKTRTLVIGDSRLTKLKFPSGWIVQTYSGFKTLQLLDKVESLLTQGPFEVVHILGWHFDLTRFVEQPNSKKKAVYMANVNIQNLLKDIYTQTLHLQSLYPEVTLVYVIPHPFDAGRYNAFRAGNLRTMSKGSLANIETTKEYYAALQSIRDLRKHHCPSLPILDLSRIMFPRHRFKNLTNQFQTGQVEEFPAGTIDGFHWTSEFSHLIIRALVSWDYRIKLWKKQGTLRSLFWLNSPPIKLHLKASQLEQSEHMRQCQRGDFEEQANDVVAADVQQPDFTESVK